MIILKKRFVFKTKIKDKVALFYQPYNTDPKLAEYYGIENIETNNKDKYYIYKFHDLKIYLKDLNNMEYLNLKKNTKHALEYLKKKYKIIFDPKEIKNARKASESMGGADN